MDLRALSTVTDWFVVCTAETAPQMTAVAEEVERALARHGGSMWHTEGTVDAGEAFARQPQWVLMDGGDVVVHLFNPAARALYRLEDLWADAPRLSIPPDPPVITARSARAA